MAKSKNVPAKKSGAKALTTKNATDMLQQYIGKDSARVQVSENNTISINNKKFHYQGTEVGEEMTVVILAFLKENRYYPGAYKEGDQSPPGCWAFEGDTGEMIPHEDSPEQQHDDCATCPNNEWGSAPNGGDGKACSNRIRLLVIDADFGEDIDPVEYFQNAEVAVLNLPPTSTKNFNKYVKDLEKKQNMPIFGAITQLYFDDEIQHATVCFETEDLLDLTQEEDVEVAQALIDRREDEEETLSAPYNVENYEAEKAKPKRSTRKKAPAKKAAAKKAPAKRTRRKS